MKNLTKSQLEDFMVTVWEGGSNHWFGLPNAEKIKIKYAWSKKGIQTENSFAEKITDYLWDGNTLVVVDSEDRTEVIGDLSLERINNAFKNPELRGHANEFFEEQYDADTTDTLLQFAVLNELVYG